MPVIDPATGQPVHPDDAGWDEPVKGAPATYPSELGGQGHPGFMRLVAGMRDQHVEKSAGYGTGADPFANFTAIAAITGRARCEYPIERMIEKLTRARSLIAQGRMRDVGEEFRDIAGLALCAEAMRVEDQQASFNDVGPRVGG